MKYSNLPTYDPSLIGTLLSSLTDHRVLHYGENQVIKQSQYVWPILGWRYGKRIIAEYETAQKYLAPYILESSFYVDPSHKRMAIIQPFVTGDALTVEHLQNPTIQDQFQDLMKKHEQLIKEVGYPLDLIGHEGLRKRCLGNVLVIDEKLVIYDTSILTPTGFGILYPVAFVIFSLARYLQRRILKLFL